MWGYTYIRVCMQAGIRMRPTCMMTSSNGNIFRVTGPLWGESTCHRWILKGQWRGAWMFSLICAWTNGWANSPEAGGLRRHRAHYDVTVMGHGRRDANLHRAGIMRGMRVYIWKACSAPLYQCSRDVEMHPCTLMGTLDASLYLWGHWYRGADQPWQGIYWSLYIKSTLNHNKC